MFPLKPTESENLVKTSTEIDEAIDNKVREITASIRLAQIVPNEEVRASDAEDGDKSSDKKGKKIPRPGHSYIIYKDEVDLPEAARKFYETAAKLSGLSLKTVVASVYRVELKLENFQYDVRRAEKYGEMIPDPTN